MSGWCEGFSRCLTSLSPLRTNKPNCEGKVQPVKEGSARGDGELVLSYPQSLGVFRGASLKVGILPPLG